MTDNDDNNKDQDQKSDKQDTEQSKQSDDETIKLPSISGRVHEVTKTQLIECARIGLAQLEQSDEPKEEVKEVEEETEPVDEKDYAAQLVMLNKRVKDLQDSNKEIKEEREKEKEQKKQEAEQQAIFRTLEQEADKYEELKGNEGLRKLVHKAVVAEIVSGSKRTVESLYKENAETLISALPKKKQHVDTKISALMSQIGRGGTGAANLTDEHTFTPDDVKSGKSLKAMEAFLRRE